MFVSRVKEGEVWLRVKFHVSSNRALAVDHDFMEISHRQSVIVRRSMVEFS